MKIKKCFMGAGLIGLLAGIVRILQYIFTIDDRGFYNKGALSDFMAGLLVGMLGAGLIWSIVCGATQKKDQAVVFQNYIKSTATRVLFLLLAIISMAEGVFRWIGSGFSISAMLCIVAGIAWLTLVLMGEFPPLMELFPLLQLGSLIIDYFKETYKYIQVSTYSLSLLGLCAMAYFALALIKTLSGAECSQKRIVSSSCILLVFGFSSFILPLMSGFTQGNVFLALHGFTYCLLAALTLIWLPERKPTAVPADETPNPNHLNQYINEIPEVQEDEL